MTLAKHLPAAQVVASDTSKVALEIAAENARQHGVDGRVQWIECDLLSGIAAEPTFDFIVSNPPYISAAEYEKLPRDVKKFEPREALLAGPKGTEVIERLISQAAPRLRPGGHLLIEISPMIHAAVQALLAAVTGLQPGPTVKDLARLPRVVQAQREATDDSPPDDAEKEGPASAQTPGDANRMRLQAAYWQRQRERTRQDIPQTGTRGRRNRRVERANIRGIPLFLTEPAVQLYCSRF